MTVDLQLMLIFTLASSLLMTDELLTRIGLRIGCKESNMFFNFLKKKKGEKWAHGLVTVLGFAILLLVLLLTQNSLLLSLFAVGYAIPVIVNAFTLWHRLVFIKKSSYAQIENPPAE